MCGRSLDAFGCGIAGEVSDDGNEIVRGGPLQERKWVGQPIKFLLADALGVSAESSEMLNDAKSAALAERRAVKSSGLLIPGFQGFIETISSGNGGAIFDEEGAVNVEPGHFDSGEEAPVVCGCGGTRCIEAWISGNSVAKPEVWDTPMEKVPYDDPRWDAYLSLLYKMQLVKLEALRARGYDPNIWSLFGSVALKGPRRVVEDFASRLFLNEPNIPVKRATHGDKSGLYGSYYAVEEMFSEAA